MAVMRSTNGARFRILVDKLLPRGISKEKVRVDLWLKEIDPIDDHRKWKDEESIIP